jgi:hypothetical protein
VSDAGEGLAKIEFRVTDEAGDVDVETLWATPLGGDLYRLENSPWFAYGVSYLDVVRARSDGDGFPVFEEVVEKSGNRTLRIILKPPAEDGNESSKLLDELLSLGASYEGATGSFMAVNVDPGSDFGRICCFLTDHGVEWEHADPTYAELYPTA